MAKDQRNVRMTKAQYYIEAAATRLTLGSIFFLSFLAVLTIEPSLNGQQSDQLFTQLKALLLGTLAVSSYALLIGVQYYFMAQFYSQDEEQTADQLKIEAIFSRTGNTLWMLLLSFKNIGSVVILLLLAIVVIIAVLLNWIPTDELTNVFGIKKLIQEELGFVVIGGTVMLVFYLLGYVMAVNEYKQLDGKPSEKTSR